MPRQLQGRQGNYVSTSRVAMAKKIKDLRQDVANLNAIVNRQSASSTS